ncbi:hypothetical protein FRX31_035524 [Thalictrum thalictroides]|uniref:Uncharacterized protein n=1 Tax=Thalictrum thalictroides TaxID=46969 RepID=A0A7J6UQQ9_THATH|nr:hypothetical protein FRX31_035524 [Thalictrum thalictroides]
MEEGLDSYDSRRKGLGVILRSFTVNEALRDWPKRRSIGLGAMLQFGCYELLGMTSSSRTKPTPLSEDERLLAGFVERKE